MTTSPVLLTGGDPAGISPEIILSLVDEVARTGETVLYFENAGPEHREALEDRARSARVSFHFLTEGRIPGPESLKKGWNVLDVTSLAGDTVKQDRVRIGQPDESSGRLSFLALRYATDFLETSQTGRLLTAPLSKEWVIRGTGLEFSGHTGYLAERFHSGVAMILRNREFGVWPLTEHVPLKDVSSRLEKRLQSVEFRILLKTLQKESLFSQRSWAFCSLNPHAGENGLIGTEEIDFLDQLCRELRDEGFPVEGPLPADGAFFPGVREKYSLFMCPYHDQALVPFKALAGAGGINTTVGLPFRRSSPDHGTAFGIAGRGIADPTSLLEAYRYLAG